MLLTISTTYKPATDMGYLLHKSPFRCQCEDLPFGLVHIFYPEASEERCTIAVLLDIDPVGLSRKNRNPNSAMPLEPYVNDRPYVSSSFMSVALSKVFPQTLNGRCKKRPELVATKMPLTCEISTLPCKGGEPFLRNLFEPLGYTVNAKRHALDSDFPEWGESPYFTVALSGETTLAELLNHVYIMIPVLDNQKHYYIDKSEIEKLLKRGEGWLATHPYKEQIARRYLKYKTSFAREALERLIEGLPATTLEEEGVEAQQESDIEENLNLNEERMGSVISALKATDSETILDLGCGEGKLLRLLLKEKQFKKIIGFDVSLRSLEIAAERLKLSDLPPIQKEKIQLLHGSLTYRDNRLNKFDAAAIIEVIEHLDQPRLTALERVVFEFARPKNIVLTTPNREFNVFWDSIGPDKLRHSDHRFEWTRGEFNEWAGRIAQEFGYSVRFLGIGKEIQDIGTPTQMAIFNLKE